jgi:carbonic anhydrase
VNDLPLLIRAAGAHCGMLTFQDDELRERLRNATGIDPVAPSGFFAFRSVEDNVRRQISRLRAHPWVPREITVRGFVYDVHSGRLTEVGAERVAGSRV